MICFQCGATIEGEAKQCGNCGAVLKNDKKLKFSTSHGHRISQEMKAIRLDAQLFPPGERIDGRYILAEMIGKGPFGEVYRARDEVIQSEIAIKVFNQDMMNSPVDEQHFIKEMDIFRRQDHPNTVRIHGSGVHKNHAWIAMQLLEGLTLRRVIKLRETKNEFFALGELDSILSQIVAASETGRGLPHCNLKPENILFLPDVLKITDSYLSHILPSESISDALNDNRYFAPELRLHDPKLTNMSDVYSLGVIVKEMIFGIEYIFGSEGNTGKRARLELVLERAMKSDPMARQGSIKELVHDIGKAVKNRGATPPPFTLPKAPPPAPQIETPSESLVSESISGEDEEVDIATIEYDRKIEMEMQNYIATTEVQRKTTEVSRALEIPQGPKVETLARERSQTAAMPVPSGKAPVQNEKSGFPLGWLAAILFLGFMGLMWFSQRPKEVVELGSSTIHENAKSELVQKIEDTPLSVIDEKKSETEIAPLKIEDQIKIEDPKSTTLGVNEKLKSSVPTGDNVIVKSSEKKEKEKIERSVNDKNIGKAEALKKLKEEAKTEIPAGTDCPKGFVLKKRKWGNYCIARYEYPGAGAKPKTRVTWFGAKKSCEARGQRLCKLKEWRSACGSKYPYGKSFDANKCNSVDEDGFDRSIARAGAFKGCRKSGVYDLVGNVHEWTADQRIAGGGFESDEAVASCRYSSSKSPGSSASYIGFRCCADPK